MAQGRSAPKKSTPAPKPAPKPTPKPSAPAPTRTTRPSPKPTPVISIPKAIPKTLSEATKIPTSQQGYISAAPPAPKPSPPKDSGRPTSQFITPISPEALKEDESFAQQAFAEEPSYEPSYPPGTTQYIEAQQPDEESFTPKMDRQPVDIRQPE